METKLGKMINKGITLLDLPLLCVYLWMRDRPSLPHHLTSLCFLFPAPEATDNTSITFQVSSGFFSYSLVPALRERLQGRDGSTGAGVRSVSTDRQVTWSPGNSSRQGHLQAAETRAGREGTAKGNPVAGKVWARPGHPLQCRCLP